MKRFLISLFLLLFNFIGVISASGKDEKILQETSSGIQQKKRHFTSEEYKELLELAKKATQAQKNEYAGKAVMSNEFNKIEFWMKQGADPQHVYATAFYLGGIIEGIKIAEAMTLALHFGANPNGSEKNERLLEKSIALLPIEVTDILLSDPRVSLGEDCQVSTPILTAVLSDKPDIVKRLLFLGINPVIIEDEKDKEYFYAYNMALAFGKTECARMLKQAHEGDFSFITPAERKKFKLIKDNRIKMSYNFLQSRKCGVQYFKHTNSRIQKTKKGDGSGASAKK